MKLKCQPEDFAVTEITSVVPTAGDWTLYRLEKRSWGTLEAIADIRRRWKLRREDVSFGGLKDRHAVTSQFVTILHGPNRDLHASTYRLQYLGPCPTPFTPEQIEANRFEIVLRDLSADDCRVLVERLAQVRLHGIPNYFDDQRFGSLGESREFIAVPWCLGNYERAVWLAIADPNPHDGPDDRRQKEHLRQHWGNWPVCLEACAGHYRRDVVRHLCQRPDDFRGAIARIPAELRGLYLSSFQSHLWNRLLASCLHEVCAAERLRAVPLQTGPVPFYEWLTDSEQASLEPLSLPLPSARLRHELGEFEPLIAAEVGHWGLRIAQLRVKYPRDSYFAKGFRRARIVPAELAASEGEDEQNSGRRQVTLAFELPRGTYATIVVKRLAWDSI